MTAQPRSRARRHRSRSIRHGRPKTWTGRIARVRSSRRRSTRSGSMPEAVLLDVDEPRDGALVEEAVGRGDEAERGRDDLVALADAEGADAHVQAGRPARAGDRRDRRPASAAIAASNCGANGPSARTSLRSTWVTSSSSRSPMSGLARRDGPVRRLGRSRMARARDEGGDPARKSSASASIGGALVEVLAVHEVEAELVLPDLRGDRQRVVADAARAVGVADGLGCQREGRTRVAPCRARRACPGG